MNDRDIIASQPDGYPRITAIVDTALETPAPILLAEMLETIADSLRYSPNSADTLDTALEALHGIEARGFYARQVDRMRQAEAEQD